MKKCNIRKWYCEKGTLRKWVATLFVCLLFLLPTALRAQFVPDTLDIRFQLDSIRIDMNYGDNARRWAIFEEHFRENYAGLNPASLRLDIYSGASPEGTAAHNRWLGENRGLAMRRLVRQRLGRTVGSIVVHNEAARWDGLYDLVAQSQEPWRDEVLRIIEMPPSRTLEGRDQREFILRRLYRGRLWQKLQKYLAPLRSGASAVLSWQQGGRDTLVIRDTIWVMQQGDCPPRQRDTIVIIRDTIVQGFAAGGLSAGATPARADRSPETPKPVVRRPAWILRTNLPLLGIGSPNVTSRQNGRWTTATAGASTSSSSDPGSPLGTTPTPTNSSMDPPNCATGSDDAVATIPSTAST